MVVNLNMEIAEVSDPSVSSDWTTRSTALKIMLISRDDTSLLLHRIPKSSHSGRQDREQRSSDKTNLQHLPDPKDDVGAIHPSIHDRPPPTFG